MIFRLKYEKYIYMMLLDDAKESCNSNFLRIFQPCYKSYVISRHYLLQFIAALFVHTKRY